MNDNKAGTAEWSYQGIDPARMKHLQECPDYHGIIRQIADQLEPANVQLVLDVGYMEPVTGAIRPIFYADIDEALADWFFNGIRGYRGQYYRSVESGLSANRYALSEWESKLMQVAKDAKFEAPHPHDKARTLRMPEADFLKSLRLNSAKYGETTHRVSWATLPEMRRMHRQESSPHAGSTKRQPVSAKHAKGSRLRN